MRTTGFVFAFGVAGTMASAGPDWNNDSTVQHAAFCVALFEYRAELAAKWSAGGPSLLDLDGAKHITEIADQHDRAACYNGAHAPSYGGLLLRGPYYPGCGATVSDMKYAFRLKIQAVYEESGLDGAFPPTCMEDPACIACRDLLRTMQ